MKKIALIFTLFVAAPLAAQSYTPVDTLGVPKLPYTLVSGVKVFNLRAEPVQTRFCSRPECRTLTTWGYNGSMPGPTIEVVEGDRVKIIFENRLSMPTAVHWHGLEIPNAMDGGGMHTQRLVEPGETFNYEFTLEQHGTFMYHSGHMQALQAGMGQAGFFIVHPRTPHVPIDKDYAMFLQIWSIPPHANLPDTMSMNFNWFTINGKVAPDVPHLTARAGQKMRVRIANLSMMSHPIHLHGHTFRVVETGAGRNPSSTFRKANTISINAGETMTIEFEAARHPGPWLFHCHFLHHITNDMDRPPIPGQHMSMPPGAGMFTIIDVTR